MQNERMPRCIGRLPDGLRRSVSAVAVAMLLCLACQTGFANECADTADRSYSICKIDAPGTLEIFWLNDEGVPFGDLPALNAWLAARGRALQFAMNGGMFESDATLSPTGLLVVAGNERQKLNTDGWAGKPLTVKQAERNFYQLPNGVFWVQEGVAHIASSNIYRQANRRPSLAIQSGPLLASDGKVTAVALTLRRKSPVRRNGVCTTNEGGLLFVIANRGVTIADFAMYLVSEVHCKDALYLDGGRSVLHSAQLHRSDKRFDEDGNVFRVGPIIGIAGKK